MSEAGVDEQVKKMLASLSQMYNSAVGVGVERDYAQTIASWCTAGDLAANSGRPGLADFCWNRAMEMSHHPPSKQALDIDLAVLFSQTDEKAGAGTTSGGMAQ